MAINYTDLLTSDNFQTWLNKTNQIGNNLADNAVCLGGSAGDNRNNGGVRIEGPLHTEDTTNGVKTNIVTTHTGTTLKLNANTVEIGEQLMVFSPDVGKSDTIQFVKGATANAASKIWKIGPVESHTDLDIVGTNSGSGDDAIFTFRRSAGATTKGLLTGNNVEIDTALLKDDIDANTATQWATTRQISISGAVTGAAVNIDGTGDIEISGTTIDTSGIDVGVTSITGGDNITASVVNASGVVTIDHSDTSTVANTAVTSSSGLVVEDLEFDGFGHVTGATTVDLGTLFLKRNPADDASRSTLDGSGILVEPNTEISFQKSDSTAVADEGHIKSTSNSLQISSGASETLSLQSPTTILFEKTDGTNRFNFTMSTGNFTAHGDITAFGNASDESLKENIEPITGALDKVDAINGYTFNYIDAPEKGRVPGVIAQELEQVLPEAVYQTDDGKKAVRYDNTVALLVEAIKELRQQVEELKGN